ncbi:hypothetical protein [Synechococcus sp. CS-603]|nr:hypothetical protein [Synechococcus sp. CS-603]MCT0203111.1 hypothetical protein [Synechococcus sp. CS-603]MCT4365172.1 hypothetical protein [Candidatus Regnicoccus frigidus MAG-AL1]
MAAPCSNFSASPCPAALDRRHWVLLFAALACLGGLFLWIAAIDLVLDESLPPAPTAQPAPEPGGLR